MDEIVERAFKLINEGILWNILEAQLW
jgi:hypothetical protein